MASESRLIHRVPNWRARTRQQRERGLASTCCTLLSVSNPMLRSFQPLSMDSCRYGAACWRPLCHYVHAGRRARRWAEVWLLLAMQEEEEEEDLEVIKVISEERIPKHIVERTIVEQNVDVPNTRDDGGYSKGAHLGVYSRTVLRCVRRTFFPSFGTIRW